MTHAEVTGGQIVAKIAMVQGQVQVRLPASATVSLLRLMVSQITEIPL